MVGTYGFDTMCLRTPLHATVGYRALAVDFSETGAHGKNGLHNVQHGSVQNWNARRAAAVFAKDIESGGRVYEVGVEAQTGKVLEKRERGPSSGVRRVASLVARRLPNGQKQIEYPARKPSSHRE